MPRSGLTVGGFTISDFHGKHRVLTVPEIFIYSSNVGSARDGARRRHARASTTICKRFGLLDHAEDRAAGDGRADRPAMPWAKVTTITMAFGHGISVSPMQTAAAGAALVNGGYLITPTFLPRTDRGGGADRPPDPAAGDERLLMRRLFRLNVLKGSGKRADVPGYSVGGKTGTAEKVENGRYSANKRRNAFLAAFPMDAPKYLVLVMLDEPKSEKPGIGATSGLNTAPVAGNIIRRIAPMLGVEPKAVDPEDEPAMALAFAQ